MSRDLVSEHRTDNKGMAVIDIIALICSTALSHAECQPVNARDVIVVGKTSLPIACAVEGQQDLGKIAAMKGENEFFKIMCARHGTVGQARDPEI